MFSMYVSLPLSFDAKESGERKQSLWKNSVTHLQTAPILGPSPDGEGSSVSQLNNVPLPVGGGVRGGGIGRLRGSLVPQEEYVKQLKKIVLA